MNNSFSLTCAQCGGQIQLPKGQTRIKCPYCGTEQVLPREGLYTEAQDMETFVNIQANRRSGKG